MTTFPTESESAALHAEWSEAMFASENAFTAAEWAEINEMLASPAPTDEDMDAMYEEWCLQQDGIACDGHKDSHYWV